MGRAEGVAVNRGETEAGGVYSLKPGLGNKQRSEIIAMSITSDLYRQGVIHGLIDPKSDGLTSAATLITGWQAGRWVLSALSGPRGVAHQALRFTGWC